jgi:hypothetical protein
MLLALWSGFWNGTVWRGAGTETGNARFLLGGATLGEVPITAINGLAAKTLTAASGSYSFTGTNASVLHKWIDTAGVGSYTLTGAVASPLHKWIVTAASGSYSLIGTAAAVLHGWRVTSAAGSYVFTGTAVSVLHQWKVTAGAGSYVVTGAPASLLHAWRLTAAAGSYTINGQAASLLHKWRLTAAGGSYAITGSAATLTVSSAASTGSGIRYYQSGLPLIALRFGFKPLGSPAAAASVVRHRAQYSGIRPAKKHKGKKGAVVAPIAQEPVALPPLVIGRGRARETFADAAHGLGHVCVIGLGWEREDGRGRDICHGAGIVAIYGVASFREDFDEDMAFATGSIRSDEDEAIAALTQFMPFMPWTNIKEDA